MLTVEKENGYLRDKVDEAENRSRSSHLHFINVPEHSGGRDMIAFVDKLIPLPLGKEIFLTAMAIERAHCSPTFSSCSRSAPRSILAKFLNLQDKVRILHLAREKRELFYLGTLAHIYPDFSASLINKHRQFDAVKKKLRAADISYSLLYPKPKPKLF